MRHFFLPTMPVEHRQASAESLHHPEAHIPTCSVVFNNIPNQLVHTRVDS